MNSRAATIPSEARFGHDRADRHHRGDEEPGGEVDPPDQRRGLIDPDARHQAEQPNPERHPGGRDPVREIGHPERQRGHQQDGDGDLAAGPGGGGRRRLGGARPVGKQRAQDQRQSDQGDQPEHRQICDGVVRIGDADAVDALGRAQHDQIGHRRREHAEPGIERAAGGAERQRRAAVAAGREAEPVGQRHRDRNQDHHPPRIGRHQQAHRHRDGDDRRQDRQVAGADAGNDRGSGPGAEAGGLHRVADHHPAEDQPGRRRVEPREGELRGDPAHRDRQQEEHQRGEVFRQRLRRPQPDGDDHHGAGMPDAGRAALRIRHEPDGGAGDDDERRDDRARAHGRSDAGGGYCISRAGNDPISPSQGCAERRQICDLGVSRSRWSMVPVRKFRIFGPSSSAEVA